MVSELLPCPFCGQQDFLIERLDSDASVVICQGLTGPHEACLARGPVGVAQDEGEEQPGSDKAVELWNARAQQHQGEPVAHALAEKVREALDRQACPNAWMVIAYEAVVQNYTHAGPAEVERLTRKCQNADLALKAQTQNCEALRAQLAELVSAVRSINYGPAHAVQVPGDDEPCYAQRKEWIDWLLGLCVAASAEPSEPVAEDKP